MSVFDEYMSTVQGRSLADKFLRERPRESTGCIICGCCDAVLWYTMGFFAVNICSECGAKYVSPRYDDDQLAGHYSEELFTKSVDYEGVRHNMLDPAERLRKKQDMKEEIRECVKRCGDGSRVLDIGCQTGIYLEALPDNIRKYGVERCAWAADYARSNLHADISACKIEDAVFPAEHFDVINMSYVIEHLQHPVKVLRKITAWLKPQGALVVSAPNFDSTCSCIFREFYRLADPRQHLFLTTPRILKHLMSVLGMKTRKIYYPYWGTHYCSGKEQIRLVRNAIRRIALGSLIKGGRTPDVSEVISPAFYGNIMTIVAVKR